MTKGYLQALNFGIMKVEKYLKWLGLKREERLSLSLKLVRRSILEAQGKSNE